MDNIQVSEGNFATLKAAIYLAATTSAGAFVYILINAHGFFDLGKAIIAGVFAFGVFVLGQKIEKVPAQATIPEAPKVPEKQ